MAGPDLNNYPVDPTRTTTMGRGVYVGEQYQAGNPQGTVPVIADPNKVMYQGWGTIVSDPNARKWLIESYMIVNGTDKLPKPDQLRSFYESAIQDASRLSPYDRIGVYDVIENWKMGAVDMGGPSTSGAYRGPVSTVTKMAEPDLRLAVDAVASEVLGRAVSEDEYAKVAKKVRNLETENPSVAGAGKAFQTNVSGLSAEARKDVMTRALLQEEGAEDFTLATKMMGLYRKALEEMPNG